MRLGRLQNPDGDRKRHCLEFYAGGCCVRKQLCLAVGFNVR